METENDLGEILVPDSGLNRTMQYGNNFLNRKTNSADEKFKSYYVVWKLCIKMLAVQNHSKV